MEKQTYTMTAGRVRAGKREKVAAAVEKLEGPVLVSVRREDGKIEVRSIAPADAARHIRGQE